jgi:hypothetical protein
LTVGKLTPVRLGKKKEFVGGCINPILKQRSDILKGGHSLKGKDNLKHSSWRLKAFHSVPHNHHSGSMLYLRRFISS